MNPWWLRLQCDWMETEWLVVLSAESRLAWIQLLCLVKERGGKRGGTIKAMPPMVFAKRNYIGEEAVEQMLRAAKAAGALIEEDGEWTIGEWDKYQNPETSRKAKWREHNNVPECPGHVPDMGGTTTDGDGRTGTPVRATETGTETPPTPPIVPPSSKLDASEPRPKSLSDWFEEFWAAYPKRAGDRKRAPSEAKFKQIIRTVNPELVIEGAKRYARFADAVGITQTEKVQQALTWLNGKAWNEEFEIPADAPNKPKPEKRDEIEFRKSPIQNLDYWIGRDVDGELRKFKMLGTERSDQRFDEGEWRRSRGLE